MRWRGFSTSELSISLFQRGHLPNHETSLVCASPFVLTPFRPISPPPSSTHFSHPFTNISSPFHTGLAIKNTHGGRGWVGEGELSKCHVSSHASKFKFTVKLKLIKRITEYNIPALRYTGRLQSPFLSAL